MNQSLKSILIAEHKEKVFNVNSRAVIYNVGEFIYPWFYVSLCMPLVVFNLSSV